MLTIEGFNQINAGSVIAKGSIQNSPLGIFMTNERQGNLLKWVAVKGYGNDWAIYCQWDEYTWEYVEQNGDKVSDPKNVQRCLPCNEEVMKLYRF